MYYIYLKENFKYKKKVLLSEKKFYKCKESIFLYQSFINEKKVIKTLTAFHIFPIPCCYFPFAVRM